MLLAVVQCLHRFFHLCKAKHVACGGKGSHRAGKVSRAKGSQATAEPEPWGGLCLRVQHLAGMLPVVQGIAGAGKDVC